LRANGQLQRRSQYQACRLISVLERQGTFADRGDRSPARAVGDLFGWDHRVATQRVNTAKDVSPRINPDGQELPAKLVATATMFTAGQVDLAHVKVISQAPRGNITDQINPADWATAEQHLADHATAGAKPAEPRTLADQLLRLLDQDGAEPNDSTDEHPSTPRLSPAPEAATPSAANSTPSTTKPSPPPSTHSHKPRPQTPSSLEERQADALADLCRFALNHAQAAKLPDTGGRRPHLNVTIPLDELEHRTRSALLDHSSTPTPPNCARSPATPPSSTQSSGATAKFWI
jgi:5-methylcytosine-specific restriction protein A